ncbi:MAG: proline dehydrogenase family protein [Candidatus Thiodiazotropha sp. (ex Monitilora ramsayi)]|nr:proline dehydrogenase family protein [Candidatus Thiodiazotropha sp. (ex Monitilora ramsayi)]
MPDRQKQILTHGERLLERADNLQKGEGLVSGWIQHFLEKLNQYEDFRIRALRFVDVLPTLTDDHDIVELFNEYFKEDEFPMPTLGKVAIASGKLLGNTLLAKSIRHAVEMLATQYMVSDDPDKIAKSIDEIVSTGCHVSLDLLGELTLSDREADRYQSAYLNLIDSLSRQEQSDLQCSLKLSSLCPRIDVLNLSGNHTAIMDRIRPILLKAREQKVSITLDMEDFEKKPLIMSVFKTILFDDQFKTWDGIGMALQSYLTSADDDVETVIDMASRRETPFHIRWVRGAYWDQEMVLARQKGWQSPVWPTQSETDIAYESGLEILLAHHQRIRLAVATHNPRSLALAMALMEEKDITRDRVEFQMLYGMAPHYQQALVDLGYRLRIYLPFGRLIPGMAYLVRRLLENASSQAIERLQQRNTPPAELFKSPQQTHVEANEPTPLFINCDTRRFVDIDEQGRFQQAIETVRRELGQDHPLVIAGRSVETRDKIVSLCPADPAIRVGRTSCAGKTEADTAVTAALSSLNDWRNRSISDRASLLRKTAAHLNQRRDYFSALEIFEAGKNWREADADVCEAIDFLNYYADQAETLLTDRQIHVPGEENLHRYQARGVCLIVPPWNFPLAILTGMLSASLVAGNCAIVKPASDTPVVAAHLIKAMHEIGIPPGVVNYLPGAGSEVGEYLVCHPDVNLIAFTGSLAVGQRIQRNTAEFTDNQHHFKKVIAEMGGKNAIIIDSSADPDEAISGILQSAFGFQGQKCSACSRVIVVESQYERICRRLADAVDSLIITDPALSHSEVGPVINKHARKRILNAIDAGNAYGDRYCQADVPSETEGYYVPPTLFKDVQPDSFLAQEEIFGPVVALIPAKNLDQAFSIANSTRYALTGGIYSRSPAHLELAGHALHAGNLYLNRGITGALVNRQPFGGHQMSGIGYKAGGKDYLMQFVEAKCITENTMRRGVAPLS